MSDMAEVNAPASSGNCTDCCGKVKTKCCEHCLPKCFHYTMSNGRQGTLYWVGQAASSGFPGGWYVPASESCNDWLQLLLSCTCGSNCPPDVNDDRGWSLKATCEPFKQIDEVESVCAELTPPPECTEGSFALRFIVTLDCTDDGEDYAEEITVDISLEEDPEFNCCPNFGDCLCCGAGQGQPDDKVYYGSIIAPEGSDCECLNANGIVLRPDPVADNRQRWIGGYEHSCYGCANTGPAEFSIECIECADTGRNWYSVFFSAAGCGGIAATYRVDPCTPAECGPFYMRFTIDPSIDHCNDNGDWCCDGTIDIVITD